MIHVSIVPETIFHIGALPVTNSLLTSWLVVAGLCIGAYFLSKTVKRIPGKVQNFVEFIFEKLIDFMSTVGGGRDNAIRFFPIVGTIFIFVLTANWVGILPGVGSIVFTEHINGKEIVAPLFRSVNSDLNMTLALALLTVTLAHIFGFIYIGAKAHLSKFFNFSGPIAFYTGILELISELSKIVSLAFRLFGNVFAGEVLLVIIGSLLPYIAPVPFYGMELFVGFIQALVFAVLAMVAFSSATIRHDHEPHTDTHSSPHPQKTLT